MRILPKSPPVLGAALFVILSVFFAIVAFFALANDGSDSFDRSCACALKDFSQAHGDLTDWVWWITFLGSTYVLTSVATLGALWQLLRGKPRSALAWCCIALTGDALNRGLKESFARPRPDVNELRAPILSVRETLKDDESFPSGHSMDSTIGYGLAAFFLAEQSKRRRSWRCVLTTALLTLLILAICFSRVYLRAHWATDAIGGFLMGAAWLALTLGLTQAWRNTETR